MTNKIYQLFEYAYIVMFFFAIYMVVTNWDTNRDQAYLFAFFGVVAVFMFFFKRRFRKKLEERNRDQ
jgi:FtsH-binding integral membrane protein